MSLVSVVIPTLNRPQFLLRAIDSVLQQTHRHLEVIVVVDRPDPATTGALGSIADPRVRLFENPEPLTAAGARNTGADQAQGEWVAFLDDDDEWLPKKLEMQLPVAARDPSTLVSCLSRVVTSTGSLVRPKIIYDGSVRIDEYLFDRRTLLGGSSFMQTSSYLLHHQLFDKVRFDSGSPHDDWGFLLRLSQQQDVRIETVPEVLAILHFEEHHPSLTSRSASWMASLRYLDEIQSLLTRRSYSGYCLGVVGERAARERAYSAFPELLRRAFRYGSPRFCHLLPYFAYWMLPAGLLQRLRRTARHASYPKTIFRHDQAGHIGRKCA